MLYQLDPAAKEAIGSAPKDKTAAIVHLLTVPILLL
jgi:hypothetical protein